MKTYTGWGLQHKKTGELLMYTISETRRDARELKWSEHKVVKVECKIKETI